MKCPFLEEVVVRYCKAYPIRKLIPCSEEESICVSDEHSECSTYKDVARVAEKIEEVVEEQEIKEEPREPYPVLGGKTPYFPAYWPKLCKVLNCPACPYRALCFAAESRWLKEPVFVRGVEILRGLYFSEWHTWINVKKDGNINVGMDDFAQKLVGNISRVKLPEIGTKIKKGENAWKVGVDSTDIDLFSPITGEIIEVNRGLIEKPSTINENPYKQGWVFTLKSAELEKELASLLNGDNAIAWLENETDKLYSQVEKDLGVTIADGGELVGAINKKISKDEWQELIREFLAPRVS